MADKTDNRPKSKAKAAPPAMKRDRVSIYITRKCADDLKMLMAQLVINGRGGTQMAALEALVENELEHQRQYARQVAASLLKATNRAKGQ